MTDAEPFPRLFDPLQIGRTPVRNRLVCLPHNAGFVAGGTATPDYAAYLGRLARTTVGMVVLGGSIVHESSWGHDRQLRTFDAAVVAGLAGVADAVHEARSIFVGQLVHLGRETRSTRPSVPLWAPSPLASDIFGEVPHALTGAELKELRSGFVRAARNLLAADADGVEIHAAHGYLLQQFLSPETNHRGDEYGGSLRNRARLLREVVADVREVAGDRILGLRVSAGDGARNVLSWAEVVDTVGAVQDELDYVSLAVGATAKRYVRDAAFPAGGLGARAAELRAAIRPPVLVSQRIDSPEVAERLLADGQADLIGLARALIADPDWGEKARSGRSRSIRPCIACVEDCRRVAVATIGCIVNPEFGRARPPVAPAADSAWTGRASRVVVVGGGPAGCMAALACARSGDEVTLLEAAMVLGGRARIAGWAPHRETWLGYAEHLDRLVRDQPAIDLRFGTAATWPMIAELEPDIVVVAIGAREVLDLPSGLQVATATADEVIARSDLPAAGAVAVVDHDGGWSAAGVVETTVARGGLPLYVTDRDRIADRVPEESREDLLSRFRAARVPAHTRAELIQEAGSLLVSSPYIGLVTPVSADLVVSSGRLVPNLLEGLPADTGRPRLLVVGDCHAPRGLSAAVREAWDVPAKINNLPSSKQVNAMVLE